MNKYHIKVFTLFVLLIWGLHLVAQDNKMIEVQGGTFQMGSNTPAPDGITDEQPVHSVTVSTFLIGQHEVTVAEYKQFATATGKAMPPAPNSEWWESHQDTKKFYSTPAKTWWGFQSYYPMHRITWYDAVDYCNWISEKNGLEVCYSKNADGGWDTDLTKNGYRLPTEAEWEFAAKGGIKSTNTKYSGSNDVKAVAWIDETTALAGPQKIMTKKPNELGIYDMSGNVWEWCSDYYAQDYYKRSIGKTDPMNTTSQAYRVLRGGSWHYQGDYATVTGRDGPEPTYTNYNYGFRLAQSKK